MNKIKNITNDCKYCIHCLKHFVKINGELRAVDDKVQCLNKAMTSEEIKERIENKVLCEYFKLEPSTELESIYFALSGIMSELCEIKTILQKKQSKTAKKCAPTE